MFKFKQFTIHQQNSAMKVCTDACLLGALTRVKSNTTILDIGTGTGLLALMLAQKDPSIHITAVEIDDATLIDAKSNVGNCQFSDQILLVHDSIQNFSSKNNQAFDLIISNPPFFQNNLKSDDNRKNKALHDESLTLKELADAVKKLLKPEGCFWVLLPPFEMTQFQQIAKENGLFTQKDFSIKHNPQKNIFRKICCFGFENSQSPETETIHIHENEMYSARFAQLLKDYYLIF